MDKLWKQITPSEYSWEREALQYVRERLPDHDPYRAWANFEFIAQDGSINEVDLLVLTSKGLFLVEIKSHPGAISGDAATWVWDKPTGGQKVFDNPRILADRKTKKLASLLKVQNASKRSKERFPFINTLVFLSAENLVNRLEGPARINVCTRDNLLHELKHTDESWTHRPINRPSAKMISRALEEAGIKESARQKRVGLYELTELLDDADHYQDWLARHTDLGVPRKVRVYLVRDKSEEEANRLRQAAQREFRLLEGIDHPGILKAKDYQQHDHGPALVYEYDPESFRLDHLLRHLSGASRLDIGQAVSVLRQIAEAVQHAHGQRLYHRALSPRNIYVTTKGAGAYHVKVANWSMAARVYETETQQVSALSHLTTMIKEEAGPYVALEAHTRSDNPVQADVFSLGTIAYHLFTGKKPAESELELQDKLSRGKGLQVTDEINGASSSLQDLVQYASHPDPASRMDSVDEFLEYLDLLEDDLTKPDSQHTGNPTQAGEDQVFDGGITVKKRLGKGACSVVFLVEHQGQQRVLKLALNPDHNERLWQEGEALAGLRHQAIVAHHKTVDISGHTGLIIDYADRGSLTQQLRRQGPVQLELLERFGDDLLSAMVHLEEKGIFHRDIKPENLGLITQGSQRHLVLFDFSLTNAGTDNITAGTLAYMDPFIRDQGRRRWDDFAERFSAALTLHEMAAGTLPGWTEESGMPTVIEGNLAVDRQLFDPAIRDTIMLFFEKALARDVGERFASAEDMLRAWRHVFADARQDVLRASQHTEQTCPVEEAGLDTQIGLLPLSAQALNTLSRRNINTVSDLIKVHRYDVRVWTGVGNATRKELSDVIGRLQARLQTEHQARQLAQRDQHNTSIDRLFTQIMPTATKSTDPTRQRFLNEYLGRLEGEAPVDLQAVHWPTPLGISTETGLETSEVRTLQHRALAQWSKNKNITELRDDVAKIVADNGGVITALELAEALLVRRGSVQESPLRERWAQAVARAAVDTELSKQESRWSQRRIGRRLVLVDNTQGAGEELADYAEALGQLADECARQEPLLSPIRTLEKIRSVPAPEASRGLSNARLLRLAAAASQGAALSSRAEFYPIGMKAEQALELAQGALLGTRALTVKEIQDRVAGRYPAAEPLPRRPRLDELVINLGMGFEWDADYELRDSLSGTSGARGAYCLPNSTLSTLTRRTMTRSGFTQLGDAPGISLQELGQLNQLIGNTVESARFLALTVRTRDWHTAKRKLCTDFALRPISFDELLLRHLHTLMGGMKTPPKWEVVLKADAAERNSQAWRRLQQLAQRVLPAMADEIKRANQPVLLTEPGLIGRYDLVTTWLNELRQHLINSGNAHALIMLIAVDVQQDGANIDGVAVPRGAGSSEWARIPGAWLDETEQRTHAVRAATPILDSE